MREEAGLVHLVPKQVLYQAELCPDAIKMLDLKGFLAQRRLAGKAGNAEQAGNRGTIRSGRPEIVPNTIAPASCGGRLG